MKPTWHRLKGRQPVAQALDEGVRRVAAEGLRDDDAGARAPEDDGEDQCREVCSVRKHHRDEVAGADPHRVQATGVQVSPLVQFGVGEPACFVGAAHPVDRGDAVGLLGRGGRQQRAQRSATPLAVRLVRAHELRGQPAVPPDAGVLLRR